MGKRSSIAAAASLSLSLVSGSPADLHDFDRRHIARIQHVQIPAIEAAGLTAFLAEPNAFANATNEQGHTVALSGVPGVGPSIRYASLLMGSDEDNLTFGGAWETNRHNWNDGRASPIHNTMNLVYLTEAKIGDQDFKLVLDTGSSDTWVASAPFQCKDDRQQGVGEEHCRLAKQYRKSSTWVDSNLKLHTAYADGEKLDGEIGKEMVEIAGVSVRTTLGLVHSANWHGDRVSSGLVGFAYPSLTRAFTTQGKVLRYDPVFFSMYKSGIIPAVFAVGLNRHHEGPGALSIGGLPNKKVINYNDDWAKAKMQMMQLRGPLGMQGEYTMYIAGVDNYLINGQQINTPARMVVDTGTTMSFVPPPVMEIIKQQWQPPGSLREVPPGSGMYQAPCDSRPPKIEMTIGGKRLSIDPEDMFVNSGPMGSGVEKGKMCTIGVCCPKQFMGNGFFMMGGTFMKSIVTVFDVGAAELRFAQRIR